MPAPATEPHLLHVFSTFAPGGPQVRTAGLLNAMAGEFRHTILPMDGHAEAADLCTQGNRPALLPQPKARGGFRILKELRAVFAEQEPDLILTYNWGAIESVLAARSMSLPVLHHEDGFRPDEAAGFKRRRIWTRRLALSKARGLIVPSQTLQAIAQRLWKIDAERLTYIPNGIAVGPLPTPAQRSAMRARFDLPAEANVVGAVGHLRGEKNFARLLRAFAMLGDDPSRHLLLLGDGAEREGLLALRTELGLEARVHMPGHLEDLQPVYAAMDVFAISSDTEQMPIALLEAMSAGLPAVSTVVGDVPSMLPEQQAPFLIPLGADADKRLADCLESMLADPARGRELGQLNRSEVCSRFSFDSMVASYRAQYLRALGRS